MDELVCPGSSSSSPSPSSFSTAAAGHHHQELQFVSRDVLEEWLGDNDWLDLDEPSPGNNDMSGSEPPAPAPKRRGRKPRPKSTGPPISHVEAERQRRDKLNRRFCELRAAVPTVSRMDKASLLADAAAYIAELRGRVEQLEAETKRAAADSAAAAHSSVVVGGVHQEETLEVRMVGRDAAALRLTTATRHRRHAAARFMVALRSLDLGVQHACVCVVGGGVTVQDAVVDVPAAALRDERVLRAALVHRLLQQSG
ncbi:hypothetical protein HU200_010694 [Digitaria exilis]|uniref:Transcription factor n=1 Tax=Digitaria exilis TaxID=1010633 RepID=A0A835KM22_9POAL|nr:hypothetical protein HU200_010694 [Digitaria exilis]CAB3503038.1 unnamed protein product [Digitaria exilis]